MKKFLKYGLLVLIVLLIVSWFAVPRYILKMITDYEPFTFERVLDDENRRAGYGIFEKDHPSDYGFDNVEELSYQSLYEPVQLNGWYVGTDADPANCVVIVHGRTSNRLKTMKYLQLFKDSGLDTIYNFFIPDLRNSGKSASAKTYMGYKFGEDIAATLKMLKEEKEAGSFILYGFSMGVMGIGNVLAREDLIQEILGSNITIDKLIFDSSLSNVRETLSVNSQRLGLPDFLFDATFSLYNDAIDGYGENMKINYLLKDVEQPILMLHSRNDRLTPFSILTTELESLTHKENIETHFFSGPRHVRIYQTDSLKVKYQNLVASFLRD